MEAAGVAGDGQDEGQGVEVDHVVAHVEELRIQTCRDAAAQPEVSTLERTQRQEGRLKETEQTNTKEA